MINYIAHSTEDLKDIAEKILTEAGELRLFALYGSMGAGKTTLINAMVEYLGIDGGGSSPTFSLVNEYENNYGDKVFHFDFYRVKSVEEVYDIGYEEYFFSGSYCFMEWPERVAELIPPDAVKILIKDEGDHRKIQLYVRR